MKKKTYKVLFADDEYWTRKNAQYDSMGNI